VQFTCRVDVHLPKTLIRYCSVYGFSNCPVLHIWSCKSGSLSSTKFMFSFETDSTQDLRIPDVGRQGNRSGHVSESPKRLSSYVCCITFYL
jgi:hypothetical protein